jgi:GAF domain-containing protein
MAGHAEAGDILGAPGAQSADDAADLAAGVTELHDVLLSTQNIDSFVQELAEQAAGLIADSLSCGITLRRDGGPGTVACSDELGSRVNELQYQLGEGPCLTALADGVPVRSDDLAADPRWPQFGPKAVAEGVLAVLSLPLIAQEQVIGALNLYARDAAAFGERQVRLAGKFAESAAGALALGQRLVSYAALNDQLRESLASRAVIDQAVGIIMGQRRCSSATAFAALRAASQNRNVKLRLLAEELVTGVGGRPPQPPPFGGSRD